MKRKLEALQEATLKKGGPTLVFLSLIGCMAAAAQLIFPTFSYALWWLVIYFPLIWLMWVLIFALSSDTYQLTSSLKFVWLVNAFGILLLVLHPYEEGVSRAFVTVDDVAAICFFPLDFPSALVPGFLVQKFIGHNNYWKFLHARGLQFFAILRWLVYFFSALAQTWLYVFFFRKFCRSGVQTTS